MEEATISVLKQICDAFGVTLNCLLSSADNSYIVVKPEDRSVIFQDSDISYLSLIKGDRKLKAGLMIISSDKKQTSLGHPLDEAGYIIQGSMSMSLNGTVYELKTGDSIYIAAGNAHSFQKTGEGNCVSLWFSYSLNL